MSGGHGRVRYWLPILGAWLGCLGVACADEDAPRAEGRVEATRASLPVVAFLGTSLTAGYGLPADQAFPARIQERIDAAGLAYRVVNAGVSGDTSAGGLRRIDWLLDLPLAVLVVELGANDMLRGQDPEALARNLTDILTRTRRTHPDAHLVIAGMRAAANLGDGYARRFEAVFPALARQQGAALVPFLLEGVAGRPELNQADGIHPTAEGQRIVANTVWQVLEPLLRSQRAASGDS